MGRHHQPTHPEHDFDFMYGPDDSPDAPLLSTPRGTSSHQQREWAPPSPLAPDITPETRGTTTDRHVQSRFMQLLGRRSTRLTAIFALGVSIATYGASSSVDVTVSAQAPAAPTVEGVASDPDTNREKPKTSSRGGNTNTTDQDRTFKPDCNYMPKTQHKASETSAAKAKEIGKTMIIKCFGPGQWKAAEELWRREANWRPMATNPKSGACGIPQSWPCSKMLKDIGKPTLGSTTVEEQMHWAITYVRERYDTPADALKHWKASVNINGREVGHWY